METEATLSSVSTLPVPVGLSAPGISGPSAPPPLLEFLQVLPQRPPRVLLARHAVVLEQRHDLLHERADIAGPQPLPDREPITADRLHGADHTVGDALGRPNERQRVEA